MTVSFDKVKMRFGAPNSASVYANVRPISEGNSLLCAGLAESTADEGRFQHNALGLRKYAEFIGALADYLEAAQAELDNPAPPALTLLTRVREFDK
jgi:hypothetical protein